MTGSINLKMKLKEAFHNRRLILAVSCLLLLAINVYIFIPIPVTFKSRLGYAPTTSNPYDTSKATNEKRFLAYQCRTKRCNGMGDRQKGMALVSLFAVLSNRTFVILDSLQEPSCDFSDFIEPNLYDWKQHKDYISTVPEEDVQFIAMTKRDETFHNMRNIRLDDIWYKKVVVLEISAFNLTNIRAHPDTPRQLGWIYQYTDHEVLSFTLRALFKPGPKIDSDISQFLNKKSEGRELVCAHVRIGKNPTIPKEYMVRNVKTFNILISSVTELKFNDESKYLFYLATDSEQVREEASRILPNYVNINKTIVQIAPNINQINASKVFCEGFYNAIFEQYLLARCQYLFITRSNFGVNAAYIRGHSDGLYLNDLKNHIYIKAHSINDIQKYYHIH